MIDQKTLDRFWQKVEKTSGCWNWIAYKLDDRGRFYFNGKMVYASRFSWYIHYGQFPELLVCHKCDNPSCVNPEHLFLGTDMDNHKDRDIKGRNGMAKITNEEAKLIFYSLDHYSILMDRYKVSYHTIYRIKNNYSWRHINKV
jgi:hypothetical protein